MKKILSTTGLVVELFLAAIFLMIPGAVIALTCFLVILAIKIFAYYLMPWLSVFLVFKNTHWILGVLLTLVFFVLGKSLYKRKFFTIKNLINPAFPLFTN